MTIRPYLTSLAIFALLSPLAACQPSIGSATTDAETDAATDADPTSTPTGGSEDEFKPCTAKNPCPSGQFCFNGLCALGCTNNGDCAADQYCGTDTDLLCHNKTVDTCPTVPCPDGQQCVNGFCSAAEPPTTACQQMPNGEDGCAKNALCISETEDASDNKCYTFPACGEDDTCPPGVIGAVCNVDLIPSKDRICLVGACSDAGDCPSGYTCFKFGGPVGVCNSGEFGDLCNLPADCKSGTCNIDFPGEPGYCS